MKFLKVFLILCLLSGCSKTIDQPDEIEDEPVNASVHEIVLKDNTAEFDGVSVNEYDYCWHLDRDDKNAYYSGTEPKKEAVYIAHDIIYYPEIDTDAFTIENYDGEREWVCYYTDEELKEYRFSTLPVLGNELPTEMMHSEAEAYANPVLHITEAGEYRLSGNWNGQIWIDLGEKANEDENAKVTLILNGVNVTCSVAPALVFRNVYESDCLWEEREEYGNIVDISDAGAKVVLVDGTENNFTGANVFRLLKPEYKKESTSVQKKRYKMDGAFHSYMSMLITGEEKGTGILNVTSTTFEGVGSELHLQIDGGYINVVSQDDGINVNEDHVSVFTLNDGRLTVFAGQGAEGDVIDSNGYITVNGGILLGTSPSASDQILDSEDGTIVSDKAKVYTGGSMSMNGGFGRNEMFGPGNRPEGMPEGFGPGFHTNGFEQGMGNERPDFEGKDQKR